MSAAGGPVSAAGEGAAAAPAKILVVDDTPMNVKLLVDILSARGYAVTSAGNGEEALSRLPGDAPDLVLLDIMMPGLSGYDVCRRIRADSATSLLPVVLVTSLDPQQERLHGIEAGADDFITKPIQQAELFARVKSLLRVKALQDEVRRQAGALAQLNRQLEARVTEQVGEIDRLGQLKRFFAPRLAEAILASDERSILAPHRREICYVFVDLRGFTAFTDSAEPEEVQAALHDYHCAMGPIIAAHEGTLDRFAGDGILIFFNDPIPVDDPGPRAARMAIAMQARFIPLRDAWRKQGYELDLGIGIARGYATLGAFGYEGRVDYTAIGSVVNLAARLCGEADGGTIVVDRRLRAALDDSFAVEPLGALPLKGYAQPAPAFRLAGVKAP